ncbi:MAG: FkbM family methyltransferase [Candidatus Dormibacteria bacterium]
MTDKPTSLPYVAPLAVEREEGAPRRGSTRHDVVVVVPTRNSARSIERCLASLRAQTWPCQVVVVDNFSEDATFAIAQGWADRCLRAGPERSRQRNVGARALPGGIVGFVDSDMVLDPSVVADVVAAAEEGAGAVVVPERSVGDGYWARVRAFERAFYEGDANVEAPRFFRRDVFEAVGGFDESLNAGEDWDLALRTAPLAPVARTAAGIAHLEGAPTYVQCCAKKAAYAEGIWYFTRKNGLTALRRSVSRPYLRSPWRLLWPRPGLGLGVLALKSGEAVAVAWRLARFFRSRGASGEFGSGGQAGGGPSGVPARDSADKVPGSTLHRMCDLVVPAHNEASTLPGSLDSVLAASLPPGWAWGRWTVLDGGSTDGTSAAAQSWSSSHASPPLGVVTAATRRGKAAELGEWHQRIACAEDDHHVVVVLDGDCAIDSGSMVALLRPFQEDPQMAVVWGADTVDGPRRGRRASAFQMEVVLKLAQLAGTRAPRAYGRFFAYRVGALRDFSWHSGQVDDLQLARHVAARGLRCQSAWDATVRVTPARGYRDFYLQTYRYFWANRQERLSNSGSGVSGAPRALDRALAASFTAAADPIGALAYAAARLFAAGIHLTAPARFAARWPVARSTKSRELESERSLEIVERVREKVALAISCRRELVNWPVVLARAVAGHVGWQRGTFTAESVQGVVLRVPNRQLTWWPIVEVLVADSYRLRGRIWEDPERPRLVLDVGAHVGSFTCALSATLPGARFICVEPSPVAAHWLRQNLASNGLSSRAEVIEAAVAGVAGELVLTGGESASCEARVADTGLGPSVVATTFDTIVSGMDGSPDIVKLDCEGGEYPAILESAMQTWEHVSEVFLEYHPVAGHSFAELRGRLEAAGLTLVWHDYARHQPDLGMASFHRTRNDGRFGSRPLTGGMDGPDGGGGRC